MKIILFLSIFSLSNLVFAAQNAITDTGVIVILNDNKTWRYADETAVDKNPIAINKGTFIKRTSQKFRINATPTNIGLFIDPAEWTFVKDKTATANTFNLNSKKNADVYGQLIAEGIQIELEQMGNIALENAKEAAKDARIIKREYRVVNGVRVLYQEMEGTTQSVKLKLVGYYSSNKTGTVQLVVFSSPDILKTNSIQVEQFLNGLVTN